MTCVTLPVNFIHPNTIFMPLWLNGMSLMWSWTAGWEVNSTLVNFYSLILLLPLWPFIRVDIRARNASEARARISLVVETFLTLVCTSPPVPPVKGEKKKTIFEKKQMSNIRFGCHCITHNKLPRITILSFSKAAGSIAR